MDYCLSNHTITRYTLSYKEALQATDQIEAPSVGFAKPSEHQGALSDNSTIIKQNNTQIQLLVQIVETLEKIKTDLKAFIEKLSTNRASSTSIPEELVTKLTNLSLGSSEKPKETKGKLRVFRDPYQILREE